jgi:hypothetical protein
LTDDSKVNEELESKDYEFIFYRVKGVLLDDKPVKKSDYILSIIAYLVLLYIANNLINWNLSFVSSSFTQVLWAINLAIGVSIFINILLIIYDSPWFRHIMKALISIFTLFAVYIFYVVFPFNFSQTNSVIAVKFILIILIVILLITIVFEVFKVLFRIFYKQLN